jgi:hypothetical protein
MKIVTNNVCPPIPLRNTDWIAVDDDTYDGTGPVGTGATEAEAIADLKEQLSIDDELDALLGITSVALDVMQAAVTALEWRALATGRNSFPDSVYLEIADEIEAGFTPGEFI